MTKRLTIAVTTGLLLGGAAAPAAAQRVEVRVTLPDDVAREVRRVVREVLGDDIQQQLAEVQRELARAARDAMVEVTSRHAWDAIEGFIDQQTFRAEQVDRQTRTLSIGGNGQLELRNISGDITVKAGGGREAAVEIVRRARGRTDADARTGLERVTAEVDVRGERATVRAHYPTENRAPYSVSIEYHVTAPPNTRLTIGTISGNVEVTDIRGDLSIDSVSGGLTVSGGSRISSAKTISGDVSISGIDSDGAVEAGSVSGDITLRQVKARSVSGSSISGNVSVTDATTDRVELSSLSGNVSYGGGLSKSGRYELQSHSGTVRFTAAGQVGFELEANTFSGNIRTDVPLQLRGAVAQRGPRRSVRGTYGDGSAVVSLTTFSGSVIVGK